MLTLHTGCLTKLVLASAARTNGAANGTTVDLAVYGNNFRSAMFIITTATITDGTHAITMEHSDNGSTWTAVPADRRQGSLPSILAADDDSVFQVGYIVGTQRYVRIVATTSAATTGGVFSAVAVLSGASVSPVARS